MEGSDGRVAEEKAARRQLVHRRIGELVQTGVICGASYGFVDRDGRESFYLGAQGAVEPWSKRKLEAGMYYDLASLTKVTGTATRILQLVESGRIRFDTPVQEVLGRFRYPGITVGNLLLHNSGLPDEIPDKKTLTSENILDRLYETALEAGPGERYCYSDPGFILLGLMVTALDGCSLEESFQSHIFKPLGMNHTSYHPKGELSAFVPEEYSEKRGWICGEVHDSKAYLLGESGSAGLFSTLEDMMAFASAYIRRDDRLFGREMFEILERTDNFGRSYGWGVEFGPHVFYHTGFTGTSMVIHMDREEAFVLLTNRIHPTRENERFLEERREMNREWAGR